MGTNPLRDKATKLRDNGYSYNVISAKLGISKSTLSEWFKDRPFTPNQEILNRIERGPMKAAQVLHNRKVKEINEMRQFGMREIGTLSSRDLWLLGLGLYIGEGTKSRDAVKIINANPDVIRLAMKWFREIMHLGDDNFRVTLYLYPDNDVQECLNFWSDVTGLPLKNFRKTQIDRRENKTLLRKNKLPHGTANITIVSCGDREKGSRLFRKLVGWMDGVLIQA